MGEQLAGNRAYIKLESDLDSDIAAEFLQKSFNQLLDRGEREIVVDFSSAQIISGHGIGTLLACRRRLHAEGGVLRVKSLQGILKETFELLMLDTVLPIEE